MYGLKHQKEKRDMEHFAGLDVSVKETSVCIVDELGRIIREVKVASEPEALLAVLKNPAYHFKRIGLERATTANVSTILAISVSDVRVMSAFLPIPLGKSVSPVICDLASAI